ncbi:uncharacterized protein FIESC28_09762 [Fusarium coffeatum]|uniref:CHK kinase-like domain-containing protein n=1 Tax=Fusarium coffeatum TaxID=231269 RepID=A0A366R062_9HYPO|nr:uncharacterized protein FIESC28_09762 [Fusarium coffeatum]RBR09650.1 hypothetical protein FIESC28_09762 [Fusarium coffeatum]
MTESLVTGSKPLRADFDSDKALPMTPEELFLDLTFDSNVQTEIPNKVVVKGGFNPEIRVAFPEIWATYRREAEFYYRVAPQTTMLLPRVRFASTNIVNGQAPWGARFGDEKIRPPVAKELLDPDRVKRAFQALWTFADADQKYFSLIHGDDHIGNTLIFKDGTPGFIDWQGLQYGPSILDVSYFLMGCLTVEDRRQHEKTLIETYLEALHKEGGPKMTRDDIWEDYKRYCMQGFLWAMTPQAMQPDEAVFAMAERYSAAIMDHGKS